MKLEGESSTYRASLCHIVGAFFGGFVNLRNALRRSGSSGFTHDYIVFAIELILRVDLLH